MNCSVMYTEPFTGQLREKIVMILVTDLQPMQTDFPYILSMCLYYYSMQSPNLIWANLPISNPYYYIIHIESPL